MTLTQTFPVLKAIQFSRTILLSGLLTFFYITEFSIGVRCVYHPFNSEPHFWTIGCSAFLLLSSFAVNFASAVWEQRQLAEAGREKSAPRFAAHVIAGAVLWRYARLWFSDSKEAQKQDAALLTMANFFFTQFFTVPIAVMHSSLLENSEDVVYDVVFAFCIAVSLVLTCAMFSHCRDELKKLKEWSFETVDLVPLIFCLGPDHDRTPDSSPKTIPSISKEISNPEPNDDATEMFFSRFLVFLQTFSFTFGRLLALGILLKLAGLYAVSIVLLQLLISVIYLKFQVPFLVSDSLPKWRQLTRFAYMSYSLVFEWHLNRDPDLGFDTTSNVKHSVVYYCLATSESVFYFVTWAVTEIYASDELYVDALNNPHHTFVRNVVVLGILSLVFSLILYVTLLFWQSGRLSAFVHSVRRGYLNSKLKGGNAGLNNAVSDRNSNPLKVEIITPMNYCPYGDSSNSPEGESELEKSSSYKDLRPPLDEEIEIYKCRTFESNEFGRCARMCDVRKTTCESPISDNDRPSGTGISNEKLFIFRKDKRSDLKLRGKECTVSTPLNDNEKNRQRGNEGGAGERPLSTETKCGDDSGSTRVSVLKPDFKSKVVLVSNSVAGGWKKASETLSGVLRKRKEHLQGFRSPSCERKGDGDEGPSSNSEGHSPEDPNAEGSSADDPPHLEASDSCSCEGDGRIRRRSLSLPPADRKQNRMMGSKVASASHLESPDCPRGPAMSGVEVRRYTVVATRMYPKGGFRNSSLAPLENTAEHFV